MKLYVVKDEAQMKAAVHNVFRDLRRVAQGVPTSSEGFLIVDLEHAPAVAKALGLDPREFVPGPVIKTSFEVEPKLPKLKKSEQKPILDAED